MNVDHLSFLQGGGELGALIRAKDWSKTPLGPVDGWSAALRTTLRIVLANRFPHVLWWGPQYVQFYNDPYRPIPGTKHPDIALGRPACECWPEIWHVIGPLIDRPFNGGPATWDDDILLEVNRHGFVEETHFTIAYSPVPDETVPSGIGGVLATVHEITEKAVGERRIAALRDLGTRVGEAKTAEDACAFAADTLAAHAKDVPFVLLYVIDSGRVSAHLAGVAGIAMGDGISPRTVDLIDGDDHCWPWTRALETGEMQVVDRLRDRFPIVPPGPWSDPPDTAVVVPIPSNRANEPAAVMVAGISARLQFDNAYRSFLELVRTQIAVAIGNARAYEEERKRSEALAALDRAKTTFFSNVSHEFRTPLTLMLGPVEDGLADKVHPLTGPQRERQELVRRSGLRLQKLVNTLLDFSRIEAGRAHASFVPTDLAALTIDLASSFRCAIEQAGLAFEVDCPPLPESVYVDPSMWEKVVLNLLSNAFKYTFTGSIRVALRWHGADVRLSVDDTGIGIPQEEIPRIFERFHRVENTHSRSHEGSGIGLSLVQELVKLHGGAIDVNSTLGLGTVFRVKIPTGSSHLPPDRINLEARTLNATSIGPAAFLAEISQWGGNDLESRTPRPDEPRRARILVADDNADMRNYIVRLLAPRWQVEAVADGVQALAAVQRCLPDLILTDIMMPRMDGLELLRRVRADERTRTVLVTLLSARAGEEATIAGLASGADDYLVKPFTADTLLARVNAQLTASQHRRNAVEEARTDADHARRLLSKADDVARARQQMLEMVSHDLRSPLSAIDSALQIVVNGLGPSERSSRVEKAIAAIARARLRMERLIRDLLAMTSIEAGALSLEQSPQDVALLLREASDMIAADTAAKGILTTVDIERDLPALSCDRDRLVQVLANLLENAVKFTEPGGRIDLRARRASPQDIELSVADTGAGISPECLDRIFDRYWRTPNHDIGGNGLGLAIAKGIVEAHHGTIVVDSVVGSGTTFRIVLPVASTASLDHALPGTASSLA